MSFNIRHGCGVEQWGDTSSKFFRNCTKKINEISRAIQSGQPDIVALQEVNDGQAATLAKAINMNYAYFPHNPGGKGYGNWWGNAILSKFQILDAELEAIGGSGTKNRSIVAAKADVNGQPIVFVSVHTDHRVYGEQSILKTLEYLKKITEPVVLIGDFNMVPNDLRINLITGENKFLDTAKAVQTENTKQVRDVGTFAVGRYNSRRIDYVFVQPQFFEVLDARLVSKEHWEASDHLAYFTKIKIKKR